MAASAPIQFTVDQEQLKVEDTNVARANPSFKKRVVGSASTAYSAVPRTNGAEAATATVNAPVQESPRTLVQETTVTAPAIEAPAAAAEDGAEQTEKTEGDIYSDAVLQCSIENKEACLMCQG